MQGLTVPDVTVKASNDVSINRSFDRAFKTKKEHLHLQNNTQRKTHPVLIVGDDAELLAMSRNHSPAMSTIGRDMN